MESDPTDDQQPLTDEQDFREEHIRYLEDQARDLQRNSNVLRLKLGLPFDFDSWGEIEMQQQGRFERKAFRDRVEAHWIVEFDSRENAKGYPKPLLICLTTLHLDETEFRYKDLLSAWMDTEWIRSTKTWTLKKMLNNTSVILGLLCMTSEPVKN